MKILIVLAMVTLAGPVQALSCMRLTPENLFVWADQAKESYVPVYGSFTAPIIKQPKQQPNENPKGYMVHGSFEGKFVTRTGLSKRVTLPVTFAVSCVASWCGSPPAPQVSVAVLEKRGDEYIYHAAACPSSSLADPDRTQLRAFRQCLRGADCTGANR